LGIRKKIHEFHAELMSAGPETKERAIRPVIIVNNLILFNYHNIISSAAMSTHPGAQMMIFESA
jgi:hypothetical protein